MIRRFANVALLLALSQSGCRGCNDTPRESIPLGVDAAPDPALASSNDPIPTPYESDALWRLAMDSGDDIDLATLAKHEGASGLLEAVERGGDVGRTALAALPFAHDAPIAFRRLCEIAAMSQGSVQHDVVKSVHAIALAPNPLGEPIDEGGRELCAAVLLRIATHEHVPPATRALAVSTLRAPPMRDLVPGEQVPSTFDPAASASGP